MPSKTYIQFALVALIVAIIGALAGWYFFIQNKVEETETTERARGSGDTVFSGTVGSTFQNIVSETTTTTGDRDTGQRAPRLWQVTRSPIAGFGFAYDSNAVFIAERATGNILKAQPDTSAILRLTNTLIPKVREAVFSRSGDVVLRTTDENDVIQSFAGIIATSTDFSSTSTPNVLDGAYLQRDIVSIDTQAYAPTSKGIFLIAKNPEGGSIAATASWKGSGLKRIFTSPLTQWRAQWLADGRIVLAQAPADTVEGYAFIVSPAGSMKSIAERLPGLTVVHHESRDAYLYSSSANGSLNLYVKVGTAPAEKLPVQTTADKCVWAPGAGLIAYCGVPAEVGTQFLEHWYQGVSHSNDTIWKIEASSASAEKFFEPDSRASFSVEDAQMDEKGTYLAFRDSRTKTLWMLRLSE
jgi:hypothetical protein